MFNPKRFLLLLSISVVLLAGLMVTSHTTVSSTALANGCNSVAKGITSSSAADWGNNCTVSEGNISNFVNAIQELLNAYDGGVCGGLMVDGNFGQLTFNAVKCFQRHAGFSTNEQDGIVGPMTWNALTSIPIPVSVTPSSGGDWENYSAYQTAFIDFRMWSVSTIWYVRVVKSNTVYWCQMNLSAPCQG